jgi:hypothetical protein
LNEHVVLVHVIGRADISGKGSLGRPKHSMIEVVEPRGEEEEEGGGGGTYIHHCASCT